MECCSLARTNYRSNTLRLRAGRPQLKRDPLGSTRPRDDGARPMRFEIEDSGHQLTVRIPPPRSAFAFVYLPAALGICLWAAASAVREVLSGSAKADEAAVTIPVRLGRLCCM